MSKLCLLMFPCGSARRGREHLELDYLVALCGERVGGRIVEIPKLNLEASEQMVKRCAAEGRFEKVADHEGRAAEKSKLQRDCGTMVAQAAEKSMACKSI